MTVASQGSHSRSAGGGDVIVLEAITAAGSCAQGCVVCADACLREPQVRGMLRCIRLAQDCGEVCAITARLVSRRTETDAALVRAQLQACVVACQICGAECEKFAAEAAHCKTCAEACHRCEQACKELINAW